MADEGQKKIGEIVSKCWKDGAYKQRFISDPKGVLKEHGIEVPPNIKVKVVENTDDQLYITLPPSPVSSGQELSEAQLEKAAGGVTYRFAKSIFALSTMVRQNGSTCYMDCIPW
jgi:nitrile hydratase alpha subunit